MNFKEMGDMMKLASEAKRIQAEQEKMQNTQIDLLRKISHTLDAILSEVKKK